MRQGVPGVRPAALRPSNFRRYFLLAIAIGGTAAILAILLSQFLNSAGANSKQPSCGRTTNDVRHYDSKPADCMLLAYTTDRIADAEIVSFTVEGDPVKYTLNVTPPSVRVAIWSQDRYGPTGYFTYTCSGLKREVAVNSVVPGYTYLVATGCSGPPGYVDNGRVIVP